MDMVIEAVIESIPLKQNIFQDLERYCNPTCILASNTSTISLEEIGAKTKAQDRIVGPHFFSPAHVMPLLEIVRTDKTAAAVVNDTLGLCSVLKKTPIVVGNCVGFTVNRIFSPYVQAAVFLVERGVDPYCIDRVLERFGFPMGPFKMNDLSGLDVFAHVAAINASAYPDRVYVSTLGNLMVKEGRLGQKTSKGFYRYEGRTAVADLAALNPLVVQARRDSSVTQMIDQISDEEILELLLFPIVNESCMVMEEGMVVRSSDIDVGSIYGYSFPAYRGGIMKWAEQVGFNRIAARMKDYYHKFQVPLFKPSNHLLHLAQNAQLYSIKN